MADIEQTDKSLKEGGVSSALENDDLPPIRSTVNNEVHSSKVRKLELINKNN